MAKLNNGLFSSERDDWETPRDLFDALDRRFQFDLDPCATHQNHKTERYFTVEDDGLSQDWDGRVFMNPPYGREISKWIEKAYTESMKPHCQIVVGLIPARTDTKYWHSFVMKATFILFIKGRVHFSEGGSAPFPSAIVVWILTNEDSGSWGPLIGTFDLETMEVVPG